MEAYNFSSTTITLEEQVAELSSKLTELERDLKTARAESKGLLDANVMAELACKALRNEVQIQAEALKQLEAESTQKLSEASKQVADTLIMLKSREELLARNAAELQESNNLLWKANVGLEEADLRLRNTFDSHSWRVTAPLRQISRFISRRR